MLAPEHGHDAGRSARPTPPSTRPRCRPRCREAVAASFNTITVDGCTSTNDTVLVLASGLRRQRRRRPRLTAALTEACRSLAEQMVDDAEGATKVAHVRVRGARERRGGARGGPQGGRLHARAVLALRRGPVLGPHRLRARLGRDTPSTSTGCRWPTAAPWSVPAAWRAPHDAAAVAAHMAGRHIELDVRPRTRVGARRSSWGPTSATATSTRTGRRRDGPRRRRPCRPRSPGPRRRRRAKTASVLVEALPYIRRFWGKIVVVKYGGNALHGGVTGTATATRRRAGLLRPGRRAHARRRHPARRGARRRPPDR